MDLRSIIDWSMTSTTLPLDSWLKFMDLYSNLYGVKVFRDLEFREKRGFGNPQSKALRYLIGVLLILLGIVIIWFPLLVLSLPFTTSLNPISDFKFSLRVAGFEPFYVQNTEPESIKDIDENQLSLLWDQFNLPSSATSANIQHVYIAANSRTNWNINQIAKERVLELLNDLSKDEKKNHVVDLVAEYTLVRASRESVFRQMVHISSEDCQKLVALISKNEKGSIVLGPIPEFLRSYPNTEIEVVKASKAVQSKNELEYDVTVSGSNGTETFYDGYFSIVRNKAKDKGLEFYILSDNISPIAATVRWIFCKFKCILT